ncbi:MAG TPA: YbhB/YbcL family Raf kinase inhibitor-like protein [Longimicrobiales bacterium]
MSLEITSSAFRHNGTIPKRHTCDGDDEPPPLAWSGIPPGTASLALIVDDPDAPDPKAPQRTFVHWVLYNLPPAVTKLSGDGPAPEGTRTGKNDGRRTGWMGPCPPIGRHRYFFKLYALDTTLEDGIATKAELERAMEGHVLERAELIGTYERAP